ncbi:hypothetical protein FB192DRAFT_1062593 [Mucor lusitanicus]|uniref:Uncharacterized protein n=1 Tax=Mucor circinelloides f. lusitanicus TaxID=29924 RepID=A0A8H4BQC1_MUCCL|nr:hypothetical protein FB192DRAFT_1062593 [Mucor lusitanicus]
MLLGGMLHLGRGLLLVALCLGSISLGKRVTTNIFFGLVDTFTTSRVANTNSRGLTALLGGGLFGVSLLGFSSSLLAGLLGSGVLLGLFGRAVLLGAVLLGSGVLLGRVFFGGSLFIVLDGDVT